MTKTPKKTTKELTNKDKIFVSEYLIDLDPKRAAETAGYSLTVAKTKAFRWVSNSPTNPKPHVYAFIMAKIKKRIAKAERSADEVIERLWFFSDKDKSAYDALNSSNTKSTELLAKHYKLLTDKIEQGFNESTLAVILGALPPEQAESVKKALLAITTHKMKP